MKLKDKIVFITGASSGIGLACAYAFAAEGANLIICARRKEKIEEAKQDLEAKFNVKVFASVLDVRNFEEVKNFVAALPFEWKNIDILINNAGLARGLEKIQDGVLLNWEEMLDTNVKGLLYVSRNVLPGMAERKLGFVINIASIAGRQVYPGGNVYCASKSAAKTISEAMAVDMNGTNVRICNIDPGLVETEFSIVRFRGDEERSKNVYKGYQPLLPEDIADIALFAVTRPAHVMIQDIMVTPTAQASATIVHKVLD